jgi:hypothetical protein
MPRPDDDDDNDEARQHGLTRGELRWVRDAKAHHDNVRWLWTVARTWAAWIVAFALGLVAFWDAIKRVIRAALSE